MEPRKRCQTTYIKFTIGGKKLGKVRRRETIFPKWNAKKCNKDWYNASIAYGSWLSELEIKRLTDVSEVEKAENIEKNSHGCMREFDEKG